MSSSKVKLFERYVTPSADVVTGTGPYTHTLTTPTHYLSTGNIVKFSVDGPNGTESFSVPVTVVSGTSFSVSLPNGYSLTGLTITIQYYSGGMTGGQSAMSCPVTMLPAVIQVVSTGAATLNIEVSLDNVNFVSLKTVTLGAAGSDYMTVAAAWAYVRANLTSVAAGQSVYVYRSV